MATAIETGSEPRTPSQPMSLPVASLLGAVYVAAAIAGVFYAVPTIWKDAITPHVPNIFVDVALRLIVQLTVAGGLIWFGCKLTGREPAQGASRWDLSGTRGYAPRVLSWRWAGGAWTARRG